MREEALNHPDDCDCEICHALDNAHYQTHPNWSASTPYTKGGPADPSSRLPSFLFFPSPLRVTLVKKNGYCLAAHRKPAAAAKASKKNEKKKEEKEKEKESEKSCKIPKRIR